MQPLPGMRSGRTVTPRQIYADSPGLERVHLVPGGGQIDATYAYDGGNTSYETELREGTIMARITASRQWVPCKRSKTAAAATSTSLVVTDARAFKAGETISIVGDTDLLRVMDDNSAASNGTSVWFHHDELGDNPIGHLESTNAGNADSSVALLSGDLIEIEDDNGASTGGTRIYFDEDATDPDSRFLANFSDGKDHFVETSGGRLVRIKHHATASSVGVSLYFDDNGATASQRLLFVSPTDTNGYVRTDDVVGLQSPATLASGNTVSAINYGTNTLTVTSATWGVGDQVFADGIAGAEIPRAILGETVDLYDTLNRSNVDRYAGKLIDQGNLLYDNILGDIAACLAYSGHKLGKINFYDDGVMV